MSGMLLVGRAPAPAGSTVDIDTAIPVRRGKIVRVVDSATAPLWAIEFGAHRQELLGVTTASSRLYVVDNCADRYHRGENDFVVSRPEDAVALLSTAAVRFCEVIIDSDLQAASPAALEELLRRQFPRVDVAIVRAPWWRTRPSQLRGGKRDQPNAT